MSTIGYEAEPMGDQSWRGPRERWTSQQTQDWYGEAAAVFRRDHLNI